MVSQYVFGKLFQARRGHSERLPLAHIVQFRQAAHFAFVPAATDLRGKRAVLFFKPTCRIGIRLKVSILLVCASAQQTDCRQNQKAGQNTVIRHITALHAIYFQVAVKTCILTAYPTLSKARFLTAPHSEAAIPAATKIKAVST